MSKLLLKRKGRLTLPKNSANSLLEQVASEPSSGHGAFGGLQLPQSPLAHMDLSTIDMDTIGLNFTPVVRDDTEDVTPEEVKPDDIVDMRTLADLRKEVLDNITNQLDVPEHLADTVRTELANNIEKYRDFFLLEVFPKVLSVLPALDSTRKVLPAVFGDDDLDITLKEDDLVRHAIRLGTLKAQAFLMDQFDLPADIRAALVGKMFGDTNG